MRSINKTREWVESKFKFTDCTNEELASQANYAGISMTELIGVLRIRYAKLIEKYKGVKP